MLKSKSKKQRIKAGSENLLKNFRTISAGLIENSKAAAQAFKEVATSIEIVKADAKAKVELLEKDAQEYTKVQETNNNVVAGLEKLFKGTL